MTKQLFIPVAGIIVAGLLTLASVSSRAFYLQIVWIIVGAALIVLFRKIDTGAFLANRWFVWGIYGLSILLLVAAYVAAPSIRGVRSWLVVGSIQFQPVELAKLGLIIIYASYFSRRHIAIARVRHLFVSFFLFFVPAGLTLLQPDLGSAAILFFIWFGFLLVSGLPRRLVVISFLIFGVVAILGWSYFLADYQKERITGVLYSERDTLGINYSVIQSKIAIGSAGLWGGGYAQGTETQFGFLTEPATDFIFPAFIEEWGIVLGILLVVALTWLIIATLRAGVHAKTNFERFFCIGVAIAWGSHFMINAGSALGLFPVVGVTFPFMSYGGSSLLTNFFLLAIINTIDARIH